MKFRRVRISSLLLCLIGISACSFETAKTEPPLVEASTSSPKISPPTFADMVNINKPIAIVKGDYKPLSYPVKTDPQITKELDDFVAASESYGVIVWHAGKIVYEKYTAPHSPITRSESASMHKSVMALLVGAAIEDGYIKGPDAKVAGYIPEWQDDPRGEITIRDLLEMSAGLEPLSSEGGMNSPSIRFMGQGESARETILGMKLTSTPGDVFHYQNATSQLLGLILENATGQDYHDYLSERLWKPLGAKDAKVWLNEPDGFARTYTALYAVPRDWLRLGLVIKDFGEFDGAKIVPKSYVEAMTSPSRATVNYGWQIWRGEAFDPARYYNASKEGFAVKASEPFAVDDILYFDGFGGQRVYVSRSKDLVVVRLGNVRMDWDDSLLPNLVLSHF